MGTAARLLVNIDVPEIGAAERFYAEAWGLSTGRSLGSAATEMLGLEAPVYLIQRPAGPQQEPNSGVVRDYARHWTPVHLDIAVDALESACARAIEAGAMGEGGIREVAYGRIATFADPFGHGFCLIQFNAEGYDAVD